MIYVYIDVISMARVICRQTQGCGKVSIVAPIIFQHPRGASKDIVE